KAASSARVTGPWGAKRSLPPTPVVIPWRRAHPTAAEYHRPGGTSTKPDPGADGLPARRHRNVTASDRLTTPSGANRSLPPMPVVIPWRRAHPTAAEYHRPGGT